MSEIRSVSSLMTSAETSGVLMAAYLLLRPYGDAAGGVAALDAFASPLWIVAHVCGVFSLAAAVVLTRLPAAFDDGRSPRLARLAQGCGFAGLVL
ncbi:MAG: hypothetical protein L0G99_17150, partial [Propionibacteriales bacterium]|nr:hypothetical protein [Propionibacteriales bacterium]